MRCPSVQNERQCVVTVGPDGKHKGLHASQYSARQWANEDDPRCMTHVHHGMASATLCGREIKAEGLCGPHLAGKRRSDTRDAERRAEEERTRARREELRTLAAALSGHLGVVVTAPYTGDHLTLTADAARALLAGQEPTP